MMPYIKFHNNYFLTNPNLINTSADCVRPHFNSFTFNFTDFRFGNISNTTLIKTFQNGAHIAPILKCWLNHNTNLTSLLPVNANKKNNLNIKVARNIFTDEKNERYQLTIFTKYGARFRPSSDQIRFIFVNVVNFPVVNFQLHTTEYLLKKFPAGKITFQQQDIIFTNDDLTSDE